MNHQKTFKTDTRRITVLGVGNILLRDEGVGVRVVEYLSQFYDFPENVQLTDGGVLGMRLMGVVAESDVLIIVDAVRNKAIPGTLYRLESDQIPRRVLAKQSMHQLDLPEVLTLSALIDHSPEIVVLGIEPEDIQTVQPELTPTVAAKLYDLAQKVLDELERFGAVAKKKNGA
ncbi:MAG: HyaD/HybD family hydrogenase maturation endopeptidase [Desulfobacteraceae bacterium]|nr:HyaD/HybD family hydrogenase maturation endopeptidase [Desulfobacteraceae bacterium]